MNRILLLFILLLSVQFIEAQVSTSINKQDSPNSGSYSPNVVIVAPVTVTPMQNAPQNSPKSITNSGTPVNNNTVAIEPKNVISVTSNIPASNKFTTNSSTGSTLKSSNNNVVVMPPIKVERYEPGKLKEKSNKK